MLDTVVDSYCAPHSLPNDTFTHDVSFHAERKATSHHCPPCKFCRGRHTPIQHLFSPPWNHQFLWQYQSLHCALRQSIQYYQNSSIWASHQITILITLAVTLMMTKRPLTGYRRIPSLLCPTDWFKGFNSLHKIIANASVTVTHSRRPLKELGDEDTTGSFGGKLRCWTNLILQT